MSDQQTAVHEPPTDETHEWPEEQLEELPVRPRRRLLTPVPLTLLGVLLIACGFIAGVLIEKGQTSTGSSAGGAGAAGLASRFAALRGSSGGGSSASASGSASGAGASGAPGGSGGGATIGQVAYVAGSTLYVTDAEGNTVKVSTSAASTVTKTVKAEVKDIRPGETVLVTGAAGAHGTVSAESIHVGSTAGSGLGALFGSPGRSTSGGGEPALFGKGG